MIAKYNQEEQKRDQLLSYLNYLNMLQTIGGTASRQYTHGQ
jgi:hypothetical protein